MRHVKARANPGDIVVLVRARIAGTGQTVSMLDSAIGALAIGAAGAALAFGAIVDATGG